MSEENWLFVYVWLKREELCGLEVKQKCCEYTKVFPCVFVREELGWICVRVCECKLVLTCVRPWVYLLFGAGVIAKSDNGGTKIIENVCKSKSEKGLLRWISVSVCLSKSVC